MNILVTSFDSNYFDAGITLIASAHRTSFKTIDRILIYDLGLNEDHKKFIDKLAKVSIVEYPDSAKTIFPDYMTANQFAWKCFALKQLWLFPGRR